MSVKINSELFKSLAPKSRKFQPAFALNEPITIIGIDEDDLVEWGKDMVPQLILDNDKKVPAPLILHNMVVESAGIIKNENDKTSDGKSLACVDFAGNTLYEVLETKYGSADDIVLPSTITPKLSINKGVAKENITSDAKKELYESSYYADGKSYDEAFKNLEFLPAIYKSSMGTLRNNTCTVIESLD